MSLPRTLRTGFQTMRQQAHTRSFSWTPRTSKIYPSTDLSTITARLSPAADAAEHGRPLLVDFYATWCQPCKLLSPTLTKLTEGDDKPVDLIKIDVDEHQQLAQQFKVSAMPTVLLMKEGKVVDGFVGLLPERKVAEFLAKHQ
ncbi:uncharacterized protein PFL1_04067 [Pseudozyma flocculosa PF-1]|uniref:Related to Thioredoxin n=2 Tax=Pseudozyma flocculosa TaxID=84751 RepID=A0A5C3ESY7_9BASI|nr:uncharacterized protein PFL1_04067 [Pseudozyma flocculosa PF-1]EPQ28240.1 hypothetical protein PFL1_04067 [Pseudozyma flocculosa PF-1]SPO35378.1 related to Thioredoxin [Pseudozyma flocculosa]